MSQKPESQNPESQKPDLDAFIESLDQASKEGRPIIPIIGAGLSADSGLPVITSVVRYFGKLDAYLKEGGYLPPKAKGAERPEKHEKIIKHYYQNPWLYIEHFGWPDRFVLNQELWQILENDDPEESAMYKAIRTSLDDISQRINPLGSQRYRDTVASIKKILSEFSVPADSDVAKSIANRLSNQWLNSVEYGIVGDWRKLILYFTRYQSDYADALFSRFANWREPSAGHLFLAFLIKFLGIKTVFTFNFDSLIEEAATKEGMHPIVFAMEQGMDLPHHSLVRDHLSIIKMHGSTHALLLDERLDRPFSDDYLEKFNKIVGLTHDPVFLVVGCSGNDYRLEHLVKNVIEKGKKTKIFWLHFEKDPPAFLEALKESLELPTLESSELTKDESSESPKNVDSKINLLKTNNPGATLKYIYSHISSSYPSGQTPYVSHIQNPILLSPSPALENFLIDPFIKEEEKVWSTRKVVVFFPPKTRLYNFLSPIPSHFLLVLANYWSRVGYLTVWVHLESLHSIAGIVTSIIDQCRNFDSSLPPALLDIKNEYYLERQQARIDIAISKIRYALNRARFFVAFDGLETYAWPATTHHGVPSHNVEDAENRMVELEEFITKLCDAEMGDSKIGICFDKQKTRNRTRKSVLNNMQKNDPHNWPIFSKLESNKQAYVWRHFASSQFLDSGSTGCNMFDFVEKNDVALTKFYLAVEKKESDQDVANTKGRLFLYLLSCFRHTRPLATIRSATKTIFNCANKDADEILNSLTGDQQGEGILLLLDGGHYWFYRPFRDAVYEENTEHTKAEAIWECVKPIPQEYAHEKNKQDEQTRKTIAQLCVHMLIQQYISQEIYEKIFIPSQDAAVFMEYVYHRLSMLRSLAKLVGLAKVYSDDPSKTNTYESAMKYAKKTLKESGFEGLIDKIDFALFRFHEDGASGIVQELDENGYDLIEIKIRHLYRAWLRAENLMRKQLPAEQLLHWCSEILSDDLLFRFDYLVVRDQSQVEVKTEFLCKNRNTRTTDMDGAFCIKPKENNDEISKQGNNDEISKQENKDEISKLRMYLQNFEAKLLIERGDFLDATKKRASQFIQKYPTLKTDAHWGRIISQMQTGENVQDWDWPKNIRKAFKGYNNLLSADEKNKDKNVNNELHWLMDIVECSVRQLQSGGIDEAELRNALRPIKNVLWAVHLTCREKELLADKAEKPVGYEVRAIEFKKADDGSSELDKKSLIDIFPETELRCLFLLIEVGLEKICVFTHDGFGLSKPTGKGGYKKHGRQLDKGIKYLDEADILIRSQRFRKADVLRNVIIDPVLDGAFYLQYRALFKLQRGRIAWQKPLEDISELKYKSKLDEGFADAYREFEAARAGLDTSSALLLALIDLYDVEACLAQARIYLSGNEVNKAGACHSAARNCLHRARKSLLVGRRNIIWWRFFCHLAAQYHADKLNVEWRLLLSGTSPCPTDPGECFEYFLAKIVPKIKKTYQGLHEALEYQSNTGMEGRKWLPRIWVESTFFGYLIGNIVLGVDGEELKAFITKLNEQTGLTSSKLNEQKGLTSIFEPDKTSKLLVEIDRELRKVKQQFEPKEAYKLSFTSWDSEITNLFADMASIIPRSPSNPTAAP
jgi:hypothetical protein